MTLNRRLFLYFFSIFFLMISVITFFSISVKKNSVQSNWISCSLLIITHWINISENGTGQLKA